MSKSKDKFQTDEAIEAELISLAVLEARRQIKEGTASSQVLTHYLALGAKKEEVLNERRVLENDLLKAKIEETKQMARIEQMVTDALEAFKRYSGYDDDYEDIP